MMATFALQFQQQLFLRQMQEEQEVPTKFRRRKWDSRRIIQMFFHRGRLDIASENHKPWRKRAARLPRSMPVTRFHVNLPGCTCTTTYSCHTMRRTRTRQGDLNIPRGRLVTVDGHIPPKQRSINEKHKWQARLFGHR